MRLHETTLGEICASGGGGIQTGPFGSQLHASDYVMDGIPSVMPQNIGENRILVEGIARVSEPDAHRLSKYLLREGDIVYSRRGDVERRALVRSENDGWLCGTGCLRVRLGASSSSDPRFISYILGTEEARAWIVRHAVGATMLNLNTSILSRLPLKIPCHEEQLAIADVLGALDDKIAANSISADLAHELSGLRFQEALNGDHDTFALGELAEIFDGPHATPRRVDSGPYFLNISSLVNGRIELSKSDHVSREEFQTWTRRVTPQAGDLLFSYETRLGDAALMPSGIEACLGRRMALLRPKRQLVHPSVLLHMFLGREFQTLIQKNAIHGATVDRIGLSKMSEWKVSLPLPRVREKLGDLLEALNAKIEVDIATNRTLAELRDTLLPALMSGRLRVKDAEKIASDET